ncbi:HNH endonuclease signature motif containing protein [Virgibacillus litoralis]|nr:HNH endonuclease signature motif containing protein [Virgibacillus litoralis]
MVLSRDLELCQECLPTVGPVPADTVHHVVHLRDDPSKALDMDNLVSVCASCHNKLHPEKRERKQSKSISNRIKVVELCQNPEQF